MTRHRACALALPAAAMLLAAAILLAGTAALAPASARGATAQEALAELNAQRAANGLPAGILERPTWSSDCAAHDRYMSLNHGLATSENPSAPGYSIGGAFAAQNAVLIQGANWSSGDPYDDAPLHLDQLLAPRLDRTGSADADGFSCTITLAGWLRPPPSMPTVYTYPGPGGTIAFSERAKEQPWTPGDLVGIRQPAVTGPYLIVLVDAPGQTATSDQATLSDAILNGPSGQVPVKAVDSQTPVPSGPYPTLAPYMAPGGFIIPVAPLQPATTYTARVVVSFAGTVAIHAWSFTTEGLDPGSRLTLSGGTLHFSSSSPAPLRVTFTRPNGEQAPTITLLPGHRAHPRLSPGTWEACGVQVPSGRYAGYRQCVAIIVTGVPTIRLGAPYRSGGLLRFPLRFSSVLRDRRATLTVTALTQSCAGGRCRTVSGRSRTRSLVLDTHLLRFPLPVSGHGIRITLRTGPFDLEDQPWTAALASRSYIRS